MGALEFPIVYKDNNNFLLYVKRQVEFDIIGRDEYPLWVGGKATEMVVDSAGALWTVTGRRSQVPSPYAALWLLPLWLGTGGNALYAPATLLELRQLSVSQTCDLLLQWVRWRTKAQEPHWTEKDWDAFDEWHAGLAFEAAEHQTHAELVKYIGRWAESGVYD